MQAFTKVVTIDFFTPTDRENYLAQKGRFFTWIMYTDFKNIEEAVIICFWDKNYQLGNLLY